MRHSRELVLANAAAFCAAFCPAAALPLLPAPLRVMGLLLWALWVWTVFGLLCALCARMENGGGGDAPKPWRAAFDWLKSAWRERLAAFAVGAGAAFWLVLALDFYRARQLPAWLAWGLFGLLGASGLWLALALLLSVGVAAEGGRGWRALWKASALLPLAYAPSALAAVCIFFVALGFPAASMDLGRWSARLWLAPLLMCPFFTVAFLAAYLAFLVRAMLEKAQGLPPASIPSWRELWSLWR
jgi:hypothetical protein